MASASAESVRIAKCMVQKANFPQYCHQVGICPAARSSKAINQAGVCSWWNTKEDKYNGRACNYIVNGMKLQLNESSTRSVLLSSLESNFCPQLAFAKNKVSLRVARHMFDNERCLRSSAASMIVAICTRMLRRTF